MISLLCVALGDRTFANHPGMGLHHQLLSSSAIMAMCLYVCGCLWLYMCACVCKPWEYVCLASVIQPLSVKGHLSLPK